MRRVALLLLAIALLAPACAGGSGGAFTGGVDPSCNTKNESVILMAQAVQEATWLPCITGYPAGWHFGGDDFRSDSATYWLSSDIAGQQVVRVQLLPSCPRTGDSFTVQGPTGVDGYATTDAGGETRRFVFEGGCVEETIALPTGTDERLVQEARGMLSLNSREALAAELKREDDVILCGAGAAPCVGESTS